MSVNLARKDEVGRISLTKEVPPIREYAPEHIAYEQDSPKVIKGVTPERIKLEATSEGNIDTDDANVSVVHVENTLTTINEIDVNNCMNIVVDNIERVGNIVQEKFINDFYRQVKRKRRVIKKQNRRELETTGKIALALLGLGVLVGVSTFSLALLGDAMIAEVAEESKEAITELITKVAILGVVATGMALVASLFVFIVGWVNDDLWM